MSATTQATKCKICGIFGSRLPCSECGALVCNIHFCDVCRHCTHHCKCWLNPRTVYHPPPNEPPPR
jgi:hypothetical protein